MNEGKKSIGKIILIVLLILIAIVVITIVSSLLWYSSSIKAINPNSSEERTVEVKGSAKTVSESLENDGVIDVFRKLNPELKDQYTWWSYRG